MDCGDGRLTPLVCARWCVRAGLGTRSRCLRFTGGHHVTQLNRRLGVATATPPNVKHQDSDLQ